MKTTTTTTLPSCSGTISVSLTPNPADPQGSVVPSASGLSNCAGKRVYFKEGSCAGTQKSYCDVGAGGAGCTGASFTAPTAGTQSKTYYACIDKNGNGDFND